MSFRPVARPVALSVARAVRGVIENIFSPLELFAQGEQGVWYDPSDLTTLYQDSAGTIPVTASGDPVGLMLDKSKGLELGPELAATLPAPVIADAGGSSGQWGGGSRTLSNTVTGTNGQHPRFEFDLGLTAGKRYQIQGRLTGDIGALAIPAVRLATGGSSNDVSYDPATGEFAALQLAAGSSVQILLDGTKLSNIVINSISVRELKGNHATQSASAARPVYRTDGSKSWLSFDGVDDLFVLPGFNVNNGTHGFGMLSGGGSGIDALLSSGTAGYLALSADRLAINDSANTRLIDTPSTIPLTSPTAFVIRKSGGALSVYLHNDPTIYTNSVAGATSGLVSVKALFAFAATGDIPVQGNLYSCVLSNAALAATTIAQLNKYIATKTGGA